MKLENSVIMGCILIIIYLICSSPSNSYYVYENGAQVVGADGHNIHLFNNPNAYQPSYNEVLKFIESDKTDRNIYDSNYFVCVDYAEIVHNNAETNNISTGIVSVDFTDGTGHAFNVFNTTDRGFVFVDCTEYDSYIYSFDIGQEINYVDDSYISKTISKIWYHW